MFRAFQAALLSAFIFSGIRVTYQHGYDAGVAAGYRELSDRILAGLRERRESDATAEQPVAP